MKTKEEIEQLASEHILSENGQIGFVLGYTQCKKDMSKDIEYWQSESEHSYHQAIDMANKKYTEDDINEMACDFVINVGGLHKTIEEWQNALWKFYQSLNKQY